VKMRGYESTSDSAECGIFLGNNSIFPVLGIYVKVSALFMYKFYIAHTRHCR
jgi:hypothetical protein